MYPSETITSVTTKTCFPPSLHGKSLQSQHQFPMQLLSLSLDKMLITFIFISLWVHSTAYLKDSEVGKFEKPNNGLKFGNLLNDEANLEREIPWEATVDIFVRNADNHQPLLQAFDKAMTDEEFSSLQDCLRDHPMRHDNVNSDTTFAGTTGFLLSFKEKGLDRLRNHTAFSCLLPYYHRYKLTNTNAWVLNMVWAEVTDYTRELAIKLHTDDGKYQENAGFDSYHGDF